jgi:rfaE bifunctional protein nucleotidyltransferase chain/domain
VSEIPLLKNKIHLDYQAAANITANWKAEGKKIIFTNGCFDLLHIGHIITLHEAKSFGDKLIIGLNDDASITRLKGTHRPLKDQRQRSYILAALEMVDLVVIFSEDTPLKLITAIVPDILVKGGDWPLNQIVGSEFVIKHGGEVKQIPYIKGYSTTSIEDKIYDSKDENKTS